jgi:predicted dehydrogenase
VEKVDAMAAAAKDFGRLLAIDFQSRYEDDVRKVKAAIDAGRLGQPIFGPMTLLRGDMRPAGFGLNRP